MSVIPNPQTFNITYSGTFPTAIGSWLNTTPTTPIASAPAFTTASFPTPNIVPQHLSNPSGSAVVIQDAGTYRVLTSVQFSTPTGNPNAELFLLVNGTPFANSNSINSLKNGDNTILTVEFLLTVGVGTTIGLGLTRTGTGSTTFTTLPSAPPIPASPAVVFTVQRVG